MSKTLNRNLQFSDEQMSAIEKYQDLLVELNIDIFKHISVDDDYRKISNICYNLIGSIETYRLIDELYARDEENKRK